jgi:hypothetical protein
MVPCRYEVTYAGRINLRFVGKIEQYVEGTGMVNPRITANRTTKYDCIMVTQHGGRHWIGLRIVYICPVERS